MRKFSLIAGLCCVLWMSLPLLGEDDLPEGVSNSQNPEDVSLTPEESLQRITVPDGFEVTLFAAEPDIRRPIAFDFDDRGRLWIVENYSHPNYDPDNRTDRVVILEDTNQDGRFDKRKIFWDEGRYVSAIAFGYGGIWLGNTPELMFIPDRDYDDIPDGKPVVILDGFEVSSNNVVNNFHWGPDGWLYGAIGLNPTSLVGKPGTPVEDRVKISRGMWRMHPVTHKFERIADGMVNPWGADFNQFGDLFTVNTVIAHLWHIVPGMYCQRRANEGDNPYVYRRIQSHADHLPGGGGTWQSSRQTTQTHSVAGGGHAHCGAMVYLGDNWPEKYHGKLFTLNLHGTRINQEILQTNKSTYVARHDEDLFMANDPWFRGLSLKYGPDGGVYISDWHDFGECHDNDGSHRTSGRIYKLTWGRPESKPFDLQGLDDDELVRLLSHKNEWFVRHARRILHERTSAKPGNGQAADLIRDRLRSVRMSQVQTLRYIWTLYGMGELSTDDLIKYTHSRAEHVRRWAVKLLFDQGEPEKFVPTIAQGGQGAVQTRIVEMASRDSSPAVLLAIASAMQAVKPGNRWMLAEAMVNQAASRGDEMLTLMIWYAIEPLIHEDRQRFLGLALSSSNPVLQEFVLRRASEGEQPVLDDVLMTISSYRGNRLPMVQGLVDALAGKGQQPEPEIWDAFYSEISETENSELESCLVRLAGIFGDQSALANLRDVVANADADLEERQSSMQALASIAGGLTAGLLHELVSSNDDLTSEALRQLVSLADEKTPPVLLEKFQTLEQSQRVDAVAVLVTRRDWSLQLLAAIRAGAIEKGAVNAFAIEQLRAFGDVGIDAAVDQFWPADSTEAQKVREISRLRELMTREHLEKGDASRGRLLFYQTCFKCHQLYGEGGRVGPDLTGSGRKQVDYLLTNLLDPSAEIDAAYKLTTIITTAGRLYSGFVIYQDDRVVRLRTQNADVQLQMKEVDEIVPTNKSMMPEGMLRELKDDQIRDLFLYLSGQKQVPLPPVSDR
ncbi:MAG: PVC-type heme-binding CxxCH protein [Planctomycetota bacterium]|nr:PVC-type heme-binding CxxCH protein [Planctomycetota bacterium]